MYLLLNRYVYSVHKFLGCGREECLQKSLNGSYGIATNSSMSCSQCQFEEEDTLEEISIFKAHVSYFMFSIFSSYCSESDEVFILTNQ